jgi:hypothetical protein
MAISYAAEHDDDARIGLLVKALQAKSRFADKHIPGLGALLTDYLDPDVDVNSYGSGRIEFNRRLLRVFKDSPSDNTFQDLRERYSDHEKDRLDQFLAGATPDDCARGFRKGPSLGTRHHIERFREKAEEVLEKAFDIEDEDQVVEVRKNLEFQNWGQTLNRNVPRYTCVPRTVAEVQKIVRFAAASKLAVRCSGYRHSWSPIFGRTGEILISLLQVHKSSAVPNTEALPLPESEPSELESIDLLPGPPRAGGKRLVRIGAAATMERLRRWCVKHNQVTLPFNIIMVEITAGGANAPICHGAGRRHSTLSDLVRQIEYVDAHGQLRTIGEQEPEFLSAASGCFGLMGVVTHLTLELDAMTYAELRPCKLPVILAVPPPPGFPEERIPPALRPKTALTAEQKRLAQERFERSANDDYYSEWFWFPYADECWVNCWKNSTDATGVQDWPTDHHIFLSFLQELTLNVIQFSTVLTKLVNKTSIAEAAVTLLSTFTMLNLPDVKPDEPAIKTYLTDGLHFQRAIQNVRVRDLEVEMPLQPRKDDPTRVDYTLVQQAWWDAIVKCYEHSLKCPQRFPLEMRIMGGSNVVMGES